LKKWLTIGIVGSALAATLTFVAASSVKREPVAEAEALPVHQILTTVRSMGLNPTGEPVRRGPDYVLHAHDRRGVEMRVIVDAHFGDVLSITPARALNAAYTPNYERGPLIIHIPQTDKREEKAKERPIVKERNEPAVTNKDDVEEEAAAPPSSRVVPPLRTTPRWPLRSDAPLPPSGPRRAVLSAPPPPAGDLSPIQPEQHLDSKIDGGDKFVVPRDSAIASGAPPPATLPRSE